MNPRYFIHGANHFKKEPPPEMVFYPDAETALSALEVEQSESVLICDAQLVSHSQLALPPDFEEYDLLHAGLSLGMDEFFSSIRLTCSNWLFLDPQIDRRCVSWKATPALCLLRPETVRALGGFDRAYFSSSARLMDLAYRLLVAGGRVCHDPALFDFNNVQIPSFGVPLLDEFIFILRHIGLSAGLYAAFWMSIITRRPYHVLLSFLKATKRSRSISVPCHQRDILDKLRLLGDEKRQSVDSISAIIPTLNRYEYLPEAISSLLQQSSPPDEVIVVDQTPPEKRKTEVYTQFAREHVSVIYLDQVGQSTARNVGIRAAIGDWCLLFEDDTAAWDDLILQHIQALEQSGADASTGLSLAPWKTIDHILTRNRFIRYSDVLATGNCLVKKQALLDIGGLDLAFDRGSGADHDLGVRLYLHGFETLLNPMAIQTHYKASSGGMRTFGAWWRNRTSLFAPYPPPTQIYTVRRYYPPQIRPPLYILYYISARKQYRFWEYLWLWLSLPWKLALSFYQANLLNHSTPLKQSTQRD